MELDRIYASLRDLSEALGPNGVNKDGTLDHLLQASAKSLNGQGELGNEMLRNLSAATETFGNGSEDLFASVTELAAVHPGAGAERPPRPRVHPRPGGHVVVAGQRAGGARAGPELRRPRRRHREDLRPRQPAGAGHRRREADPGRQEHQLRAGQPRHRAPGRSARARQPGGRLQQRDRDDRLADRRQRDVRRRRRTALLDRAAVGPPEGQQEPRLHPLRAAPRAGRGRSRAGPRPRRLRRPDRRAAEAQLAQVDPASRTVPRQYAANDDASFGSLVGGGS